MTIKKVIRELQEGLGMENRSWFVRKIWWPIEYFFDKIIGFFQNKFLYILQCYQWCKFLKEDFDWDYAYIIRTLIYKLQRTKYRILKNDLIEGAQKVGDEIQTAIDMLELYESMDLISSKEYKEFVIKWGYRIIFNPFSHEYRNAKSDEEIKQADREYLAMHEQFEKNKHQQLVDAFAYIAEHIENWWD